MKGKIVTGLWLVLHRIIPLNKMLMPLNRSINIFHRYYYRPNTKISENTWAMDAILIDTRDLPKGTTAKELDTYLDALKNWYPYVLIDKS